MLEFLFKSRVKGHARRLKSGKVVNVREHEDHRTKQAPVKREIVKPFYSRLERLIENKMPNRAPADMIRNLLKPEKGLISADEVKWSGIDTFLEGKKTVAKDDILAHLRSNEIEVTEVEKKVDKGRDAYAVYDGDENIYFDTRPEAEQYATEQGINITEDTVFKTRTRAEADGTKYAEYTLPGGPLSRDTEILTDKGWKRMDEVEVGDIILSRKDKGGILEWVPVEAVPSIYSEKLYHFKSQSVDMMTTPCHQMVVEKRIGDSKHRRRELIRMSAEELWNTWDCRIPLTGTWDNENNEKLFGLNAADVAEFIGWYLSEGSYKHKNGFKHTIQIAQCNKHNPENCDNLEKLFDRLGFKWKYYGNGYGVGYKSMPRDLAALLHAQPKSEGKYIPDFFYSSSRENIERLLKGLIEGDGCVTPSSGNRKTRTVFHTKSKNLADGVQILALLVGRRATIRQRKNGLYYMGINTKQFATVDDAKHDVVDYNDTAFCVTVKNHAIYVRRNGVAAFTGNSNYKELLLTLPEKEPASLNEIALDMYGKAFSELGDEEANKVVSKENRERKSITFRSSHWDGTENILAHVRFNERTDAEGNRVLFLEEIQSDWALQGRKQGFKGEKLLAAKFDTKESAERAKDIANDPNIELVKVDDKWRLKDHREGVPDAPLLKNWHEFTLKRMLRYAAEKGFDKMAWVTGQQTADRYDLSKQVEAVQASKDKAGTYSLRVYPLNGDMMRLPNLTEAELGANVGKDLAEKIINETPSGKMSEYSGLDLKVGGTWATTLYDKVIPNYLNKYGKKWGVKVGKSDIQGGKTGTTSREYEGKTYSLETIKRLNNSAQPPRNQEAFSAVAEAMERGSSFEDAVIKELSPYEASKLFSGKIIEKENIKTTDQLSIPITKKMRESILYEGQSLFKSLPWVYLIKSRVKAHTRKTKSGKVVQVKEHTDSRLKKKPVKKVAKKKVTKKDDLDYKSKDYKYKDVGHIPGSRKEQALLQIRSCIRDKRGLRQPDLDWTALEENPKEAYNLINKQNVFGASTFDEMEKRKVDPGAAFLIQKIYTSVAARPEDSPLSREDYVNGINALKDRMGKCKTLDDVLDNLKEIGEEITGFVLNPVEAKEHKKLLRKRDNAWNKHKALREEFDKIWNDYYRPSLELSSIKYERESRIRRGWKPDTELDKKFKTLDKKVKKLFDAQSAWRKKNQKTMDAARKKAGEIQAEISLLSETIKRRNVQENLHTRGYIALGKKFAGVAMYRRFGGSDSFGKHVASARAGRVKDYSFARGESKVKKGTKQNVRFQLAVADHIERKGGRPIAAETTEELKKHFRLKNVQSGNWVLKDINSAKFHVEHSSMAFQDMADMLKIPDRDISMNNRLSIAFGARGQGLSKASAHYESKYMAMNLTKMKGGGSLSHEWFHGIDHIGGEIDRGTSGSGTVVFTTDTPKSQQSTPVQKAFGDLVEIMTAGKHGQKETITLTERERDHWKRQLESRTSYGRDRSSAFFVVKDATNLQDAMDKLHTLSKEGKFGTGKKGTTNYKYFREMAVAQHKGKKGTFIEPGSRGSKYLSAARRIEYLEGRKSTYWSSNKELAARAFEGFIEDKLTKAGRRNTYLVGHANNQGQIMPNDQGELEQVFPYPEGTERKKINKALDNLFKVIKKEKTLKKAMERMEARGLILLKKVEV